jgi:threonine aldolase
VENTHNRGSGRTLDRTALDRIQGQCNLHNLTLHCDGARIWNAAAALNCSEKELTRGFDSVSVCFSKGLGAPVGSALLGRKEFIDRARKVRKRWGGGMRQAGYLAAGALFAVQHNRQRLKTDHEHLKALFDGISKMTEDGLPVTASLPEIWTNILYFTVKDADFLVSTLRQQGILLTHLGHGRIRAVTHLEITEKDITATLQTLRRALS